MMSMIGCDATSGDDAGEEMEGLEDDTVQT